MCHLWFAANGLCHVHNIYCGETHTVAVTVCTSDWFHAHLFRNAIIVEEPECVGVGVVVGGVSVLFLVFFFYRNDCLKVGTKPSTNLSVTVEIFQTIKPPKNKTKQTTSLRLRIES